MRRKQKELRQRKPRNFYAVSAWFRNSAGAMKSDRKEEDKYACRNFDAQEAVNEAKDEYIHEEEILAHWCESMDPEAYWNGDDDGECYCSRIRKSGSE